MSCLYNYEWLSRCPKISLVLPYATAVGNEFGFIDDSASPHRAPLQTTGLKKMAPTEQNFPDGNLIEHAWDAL